MEDTWAGVGTFVPTAGKKADSSPRGVELEEFVERVRNAASRGIPAEIEAAVMSLRPDWNSVSDWVRMRPGRYTRSLVHRDDNVEIIVLSWSRRSRAPIHDHAGQRCWMYVAHGALEMTDYRLVSGGRTSGAAFIEPLGPMRVLKAGEFDARSEYADVHAVRCAEGSDRAVSVHVYARPIDRCLVFDARRGRCEEKRMRYDFIGPRTRREPLPSGLGLHSDAPEGDGPMGWARRLWRRARETGEDLLVPSRVSDAAAQVRVKDVGHRYGEVEALRDVSLNVRSGEFVCLLGPSGCGKSTLLHALAGHVKPTGGEVSIDGRKITGPGPDRLLMFQDPALFPWMTVQQNITFVLAAQGVPKAERTARAREFLSMVQLEGFERTLPHQLSGGMKMRASLARVLALDPPVLLMDEPFGSLDAQTRSRMHELLHRIWLERQKTIVFVTHDVHEALLLATRVVVMAPRPGRVAVDLEVKLPSDRNPDDPQLAGLAGRIRAVMRVLETEGRDADEAIRAAVRGDRWVAGALGDLRPGSAVARAPLSGTARGRH